MFSDYKNKKQYWFAYHRKVKKEAEAIVRALPVMLKQEYGLAIENLFYESAIDPSDQWNPVTRSLRKIEIQTNWMAQIEANNKIFLVLKVGVL